MIKYIKNKVTKNPFLISFVFLIFAIVFLSIFFNKISRDNLTEQIQHRQQLAARAGSRSIGVFLNAVGRNISTLSSDPTNERLRLFIENWSNNSVAGVILVDKNGKVVFGSNRKGIEDTGIDVSNRSYFSWAKTAKGSEYLVSSPVVSKVGETKGEYIITITSPVVKDGSFDGVVVSAILVSELAHKYLDNIKVLDTSRIYLVTNEGEVIYSDIVDLIGKNFKEIFKVDFLGKQKILEIIDNEFDKNDESKIKLVLPNFDNNNNLEPYLISAAPVNLNDSHWKVVISVPQKDLNVFTFNFFNNQIIAIFVLVTIFILLTLRASKDSGYQEAVVDEHIKHNIK